MTTTSEHRWWDLPAAALLLVALETAATRLVATRWTDYLSIVQTIAFFGTIAGLAIGQSRFPRRAAGFLALAYGIFAVPWQLGLTLGRGILWSERLQSLVGRLNVIIYQLLHQEVVQDSLLFIVLMSALFWLLSVHASYTLTRYGNAWRAILPTGLAMFVIHSFDALVAQRAWYLAVYLFFALVLVARVAYLHQHNRWQQSRTALPPHLGLDFIRFTLLASALLIIFSWTVPALANTLPVAERVFQQIKQPWNEVRDRMDNAFASLRSSVGVVSDYYGSSVLLGRGNRLTDSNMFNVVPPEEIPEGTRFYWRAKTYDTYLDGQWISSASRSRPFNPQDEVVIPRETIGRWLATFDVVTASPISTIYSPAQPLWVSRPGQVEFAENSDGSTDLSSIRAAPAMRAGEVYQVQASVSDATEAQLRAAGSDYPEWVTERYLKLPDDITLRTRQLAREITSGLDNPYDQAVAITNYLRNNIQYTETIPNQPASQESIDWFLFDLQQGFCNYYASAEVILLRSLGIPARWSIGYAQGEKLDDGTFIVRQRDAHAWPEVFFPGLGWVEFEPTASQPVIARVPGDSGPAAGEDELTGDGLSEAEQLRQLQEELALQRERQRFPPIAARPQNNWINIVYWAVPLALGGVLLAIAYRTRERYNLGAAPIMIEKTMLRMGIRPPDIIRLWARRAALPPLTKAYLEINHALNRLGRRPMSTETPSERASALVEELPAAETPAQRLVSEYQVATFSPQPADLPAARQAGSEIRSLSFKALLRRLLARLQQPPRTARTWRVGKRS